ncbi:hypothetical protein TNIN_339481 [Trichonephila inaurata madagascariensis]|uniref:Uncharacterized protein n=1 Tax=Trichonephila inaurata madagascariensis TaxID=2747483 RepID=A0A8X6MH07_9ARAC|nr:hypothetical protein TNIN_339481 [Trichonephila inaurata madagascariensis]
MIEICYALNPSKLERRTSELVSHSSSQSHTTLLEELASKSGGGLKMSETLARMSFSSCDKRHSHWHLQISSPCHSFHLSPHNYDMSIVNNPMCGSNTM